MVDATTIAAKLMSLERRIQKVPSDGNCLFHSVADQISNHPTQPVPITAKHLRSSTVQYLREHKVTLQVNSFKFYLTFAVFTLYDNSSVKPELKRTNFFRKHYSQIVIVNFMYFILAPYQRIS